MAKKRKIFLHVGLAGDSSIEKALFTYRHALAELGVTVAPENAGEMFLAALEMTHTHKTWGYRRRDVEGTWAGICRRILKTKGTNAFVLSQPLLGAAAPEQIDLLVDQLPGLAVHVVLVAPVGADMAEPLERWGRAVRKPERVHVLPDGTGHDPEHVWRELGRVMGFGTASLSLAARPAPPAKKQKRLGRKKSAA